MCYLLGWIYDQLWYFVVYSIGKFSSTVGMPKKLETFRVYIAQVNQTYVDVRARDPGSAEEKAYRKWRKQDAHARILGVGKPDGRPSR